MFVIIAHCISFLMRLVMALYIVKLKETCNFRFNVLFTIKAINCMSRASLLRGGSTGRFACESRYRTGYLHEAQWMVRPRRSTTVSIANLGGFFYLLDLRPATRPTAHINTIPSIKSAAIVTIKLDSELLAGFKNGYGYQPVRAPRIIV